MSRQQHYLSNIRFLVKSDQVARPQAFFFEQKAADLVTSLVQNKHTNVQLVRQELRNGEWIDA